MHLTRHTDYALRVLLFVGSAREAVTIRTIATAYGISQEHLRKVVHALAQQGYLQTTRGRNGGMQLARPAASINMRDVVESFEGADLVECFVTETNTCPIDGMCGLKGALRRAHTAFLEVLGHYHLADLIRSPQLVTFVQRSTL